MINAGFVITELSEFAVNADIRESRQSGEFKNPKIEARARPDRWKYDRSKNQEFVQRERRENAMVHEGVTNIGSKNMQSSAGEVGNNSNVRDFRGILIIVGASLSQEF